MSTKDTPNLLAGSDNQQRSKGIGTHGKTQHVNTATTVEKHWAYTTQRTGEQRATGIEVDTRWEKETGQTKNNMEENSRTGTECDGVHIMERSYYCCQGQGQLASSCVRPNSPQREINGNKSSKTQP